MKGEGGIVALQRVGHVNVVVVDDRVIEHYEEVSPCKSMVMKKVPRVRSKLFTTSATT